MFSHMLVGSNDVAPRAKAFYDAVLGALGVASATPDPRHRLMHWHRGALFLVGPPLNGEKATVANGGTIGFACDSEAQVDARHAAGIAHGGTTCEDPGPARGAGDEALSRLSQGPGRPQPLCAVPPRLRVTVATRRLSECALDGPGRLSECRVHRARTREH